MEAFQKFCIRSNSLIHRVIYILLFVVVVFVFVDQKSYIIECNYCYWGIQLFYLQNRKIHKSTWICKICLPKETSNFYPD